MKKISTILILLLTGLFFTAPCFAADAPNLSANTHIQDYGWRATSTDDNHHMIIGTMGEAKRIEAIQLSTDYPGMNIVYNSFVQDIGFQGERSNGETSGTEGQRRQIEAFYMYLTGDGADQYDLYYRTHVENYGWLNWAKNGEGVGTTNHFFRCEALEILIAPKDTPHNELDFTTPYVQAMSRTESRHIYLINKLRQSHGFNCVSSDPNLKKVCDARVQELPVRASHARPNGSHYETIVKDVFPNYPYPGGGFIENWINGRTDFKNPEPAFDCYMCYPHMTDIMLDPAIRYASWSGIESGNMGYSLEVFSGLEHIDFGDY